MSSACLLRRWRRGNAGEVWRKSAERHLKRYALGFADHSSHRTRPALLRAGTARAPTTGPQFGATRLHVLTPNAARIPQRCRIPQTLPVPTSCRYTLMAQACSPRPGTRPTLLRARRSRSDDFAIPADAGHPQSQGSRSNWLNTPRVAWLESPSSRLVWLLSRHLHLIGWRVSCDGHRNFRRITIE